jgi:hypothetical protein
LYFCDATKNIPSNCVGRERREFIKNEMQSASKKKKEEEEERGERAKSN